MDCFQQYPLHCILLQQCPQNILGDRIEMTFHFHQTHVVKLKQQIPSTPCSSMKGLEADPLEEVNHVNSFTGPFSPKINSITRSRKSGLNDGYVKVYKLGHKHCDSQLDKQISVFVSHHRLVLTVSFHVLILWVLADKSFV